MDTQIKSFTHVTKAKDILPNKLSDLILVALSDLKAVEKVKAYKIDMGKWHALNSSETACQVCQAGVVMARSLDCPIGSDVTPSDYPRSINRKLIALDSVREGSISDALYLMGIKVKTVDQSNLVDELDEGKGVSYSSYDKDPAKYKRYLLQVSKKLKAVGL